ncbi:outer membrane protein assembly factor BamD [Corticibacter populi]|uniref:Outer membrane protein assembly factor BamD n=1 Tax=Corticibacter populi TaxID=1550736 RepID=A0A3M6QYI0_9BURK|nr:outer membrane protein assembly factor BamD [Corticibacter populi]RMX08074.1 outer membrane protein assembly factor BamD [Corticibacter populi]RZS35322.1 Beta-barrel assembly machine subunit BamD [Corticibacter populi]
MKSQTIFLRLGATAISVLVLAGCASSGKDPSADWPADKLYSEARSEISAANYEKAVPLLERLEGRAAGSVLAQQAQLEKAYAQYRDGERAQAIATLDRFMMLHPTSPAMDYALYLKGIINFNDNLGLFAWLSRRDLSERDQKAAKESFESFKQLVERFPDSKYAPDAHQRMVYIVNSLAAYEVHVARYYYSRGAYVAAINRAQLALQDYKDAPALPEALEILERSYDALGMTELRDDTRRIMAASFPEGQSPQASAGSRSSWWRFWD